MEVGPSTDAGIHVAGDAIVAPRRGIAQAIMARRWSRVMATAALVLGLFWSYSLVVVPQVEPSVELKPIGAATEEGLTHAKEAVKRQREELSAWFRPGDWELQPTMIIDLARAKLLLKSYEPLPNGDVEFKTCTIIFLPEGKFASDEERQRRAVILQAPEGAVLKFDPPFNPRKGSPGKVVGGLMRGAITIRSDQRLPGPQDDLLITTRDVELQGDKLVTSHPVDFQLGPSQGHGKTMEISLRRAEVRAGAQHAPNFDGVREFILKNEVRMHVQPGRGDLFPSAAVSGSPAAANPAQAKVQPPIEITCTGPFRFDAEQYIATFHDQVDVVRLNLNGPGDQMTCDLLSLFFEPAATEKPAASKKSFPSKLEAARIEAVGNPLIIRSQANGAQARGRKLSYDIRMESGSLTGPGWFKGNVPTKSIAQRGGQPPAAEQPLEATWAKHVLFRPHQGNRVLTMEGNATVDAIGIGRIEAREGTTREGKRTPGELHLWLVEAPDDSRPPSASGRTRKLMPARMLARGNVTANSPQLQGATNELQVWFEYNGPATPALAAAAVSPLGFSSLPPARDASTSAAPVLAAPVHAAAPGLPTMGGNAAPRQRFDVQGDLVQIEVTVRGKERPNLSNVVLEGNVRLSEIPLVPTPEQPMVILGDQLTLEQPAPEAARVRVSGRQARVLGRGMTVDGGKIHVDQARNTLWIEGPGTMTQMVDRDLDGKPLPVARPMAITWKERMDFDGRVARFSQGIEATLDTQRLETNQLDATFDRPIQFGKTDLRERPGIERVDCRGGVFVEHVGMKEGRRTSLDRVQTRDLSLHQTTGEMTANGPGWVRSVRIDDGKGLPGMPVAPRIAAAPPDKKGLLHLGVHFQGKLTGHRGRNEMTFHDRVRTVYGHVPDWEMRLEPDDPESLGADGALIKSEVLEVWRLDLVPGQDPTLALIARGRVEVSSAQYFASAAELKYDQAKDQIILAGDGRAPASLSRQEVFGGPSATTEAGKIWFYPKSRRVQIDDSRGGEGMHIGNLPGAAPRAQ